MGNDRPITWVILISGFLQDRSRPNGIVRLWQRLFHRADQNLHIESPWVWNERWAERAEMLWLAEQELGRPLKIIVAGYSYGAGWGAMQLAKQLRKRGMGVYWAVLSDPVYRCSWLIGRWLAMTVFGVIGVPDNVANVSWFRQRMNRPQAHDLLPMDEQVTHIREPKELKRTHQYMDDAPEFHAEVERVVML